MLKKLRNTALRVTEIYEIEFVADILRFSLTLRESFSKVSSDGHGKGKQRYPYYDQFICI